MVFALIEHAANLKTHQRTCLYASDTYGGELIFTNLDRSTPFTPIRQQLMHQQQTIPHYCSALNVIADLDPSSPHARLLRMRPFSLFDHGQTTLSH